MVSIDLEHLTDAVQKLIEKSVISVPDELKTQLSNLMDILEKENNTRAITQLKIMLENLEYAENQTLPICQDTGIPTFFVKLGLNSENTKNLEMAIKNGISKVTEKGILRPNSVDPITNKNSGNNLGENTPPIYYEINEEDQIIVSVLNKGGGAENYSALFMLSSSNGLKDLEQAIVNRVIEAGGKPCPPIIVGVGIGGDASKCMYLAKKSLLRKLGSSNQRADVAEIEERLLKTINQQSVGVMGLHGPGTCLAVHCEIAMRHPASYPVGIIIQCYAHRTYSMRLLNDRKIEYGRLNEKYEFIKEDL